MYSDNDLIKLKRFQETSNLDSLNGAHAHAYKEGNKAGECMECNQREDHPNHTIQESIDGYKTCPECGGGKNRMNCPECHGMGQVKETKRDPFEGIDKLATPDTKIHGQQIKKENRSGKVGNDTYVAAKARGHGESDADVITDKQQTKKPTKPDTFKL